MSRRNPMNDRYTNTENAPQGQTRKSAARAKPKTKAGASVNYDPTGGASSDEKMSRRERKAAEAAALENMGPRAREKYMQHEYVLWNNRRRRMVLMSFVALFIALIYRYSVPEVNEVLSIALWILPFLFIGIGIWMSYARQRPLGRILGITYDKKEKEMQKMTRRQRQDKMRDEMDEREKRVMARVEEKQQRTVEREQRRLRNKAAQESKKAEAKK